MNQWISVWLDLNLIWPLNNAVPCWIVKVTIPFRFNFHTYLQRPSWSRPDAQPGFFPWHMGAAGKALWVRSQRRWNCSSEKGANAESVNQTYLNSNPIPWCSSMWFCSSHVLHILYSSDTEVEPQIKPEWAELDSISVVHMDRCNIVPESLQMYH